MPDSQNPNDTHWQMPDSQNPNDTHWKTVFTPPPQPWEPPEYTPITLRRGFTDYQCQRCGVFVSDFIQHNTHHRALDQLKDGFVSLTKILLPDVPAGTLLSMLGTAYDITEFIEGFTPGGQGGQGAAGSFGVITVGKGGGGNNPDIPECPICHAYGGGGHGGGCKNAGRPVSQWTDS